MTKPKCPTCHQDLTNPETVRKNDLQSLLFSLMKTLPNEAFKNAIPFYNRIYHDPKDSEATQALWKILKSQQYPVEM